MAWPKSLSEKQPKLLEVANFYDLSALSEYRRTFLCPQEINAADEIRI